jgi:hypothetical protein
MIITKAGDLTQRRGSEKVISCFAAFSRLAEQGGWHPISKRSLLAGSLDLRLQ